MNNIDKFINDFADNYSGAGYCSYHKWFGNFFGMGLGVDCSLGRGRGDSNGYWNSRGFGEGNRSGGYIAAASNEVIGHCYVNVENLYGQHR